MQDSRSCRPFRRWAPVIAVAFAALVAAACSSSGSGSGSGSGSNAANAANAANGTKTQTLTVGTSADFPPVSFKKKDSSTITGFEDDMLKFLTPKLNAGYKWQQLDFNGLISALQSGRLSLVVSGMYHTDKRAEVVDFVDYMKIPLAVLTLKSNISKVTGPMSLCGKSVAYLVGSPPELTQLDAWSKQCKSAGKSGIDATGYQSVSQAVANVSNGRTFAELEGDIVVLYVANSQYGSKLGVGFDVPGGTSTIGLAVKKGSSLLPKIKAAMKAFIASPAYCTAAAKWQLTPGDLLRKC
jgi:polar amino acid transport system substrate-binding protein